MKAICKDYYMYSKTHYMLNDIQNALSNDSANRYWVAAKYFMPMSVLIRLSMDEVKYIRNDAKYAIAEQNEIYSKSKLL